MPGYCLAMAMELLDWYAALDDRLMVLNWLQTSSA